jgi:hypothetical protein
MTTKKSSPEKSQATRQQEQRILKEQKQLAVLRKKDQARAWARDIRQQSNALIQKLETDNTIPYQTPIAEIRTLRKTLDKLAPQMSATGGFFVGLIVALITLVFIALFYSLR